MRNQTHINKDKLTILHTNVHALAGFWAKMKNISQQRLQTQRLAPTCVYALRLQPEKFALAH